MRGFAMLCGASMSSYENPLMGKVSQVSDLDNIVDFAIFDNVLKRKGFDINEVELIEGLLFISMISLHHDEPEML